MNAGPTSPGTPTTQSYLVDLGDGMRCIFKPRPEHWQTYRKVFEPGHHAIFSPRISVRLASRVDLEAGEKVAAAAGNANVDAELLAYDFSRKGRFDLVSPTVLKEVDIPKVGGGLERAVGSLQLLVNHQLLLSMRGMQAPGTPYREKEHYYYRMIGARNAMRAFDFQVNNTDRAMFDLGGNEGHNFFQAGGWVISYDHGLTQRDSGRYTRGYDVVTPDRLPVDSRLLEVFQGLRDELTPAYIRERMAGLFPAEVIEQNVSRREQLLAAIAPRVHDRPTDHDGDPAMIRVEAF